MKDHLFAIEEEFAGLPGNLAVSFRRSVESLAATLTDEELEAWAREGLSLARGSLRSWEAAGEYLRASPQVLASSPFQGFLSWAEGGRELAQSSSVIAGAYFNAGPATLPHLSEAEIGDWGRLGASLYRGTWKSISLAARFFELGPPLLAHLSLDDARLLVRFANDLAERSNDLALACLDMAPWTLAAVAPRDRAAFIGLGIVVVEHGWADARVYFERGPGLVNQIEPSSRSRFLQLMGSVAPAVARQTYASFAEGSNALAGVDAGLHAEMIERAEQLSGQSGAAAIAFIKSAPEVLSRVRVDALPVWHERGRRILETNIEGGEAFFRLESSMGEEVLDGLSSRVELGRVAGVLRLYCKALTGANVAISPVAGLAEKGIGWISSDMPSTEGSSIYLPEAIEAFGDKDGNFSAYKVYSTHQAGHLEFGSFWFHFERPGTVLGDAGRRLLTTQTQLDRKPLTQMERFFDLFDDRQLASDLFAVVEDARVDARIGREYGGIRPAYHRVQQIELAGRTPPRQLPLRQAFVELLVLLSLEQEAELLWPRQLAGIMRQTTHLLNAAGRPEAIVEDAAEATIALYDLARSIPNVDAEKLGVEPDDWVTLERADDFDSEQMSVDDGFGGSGPAPLASRFGQDDELPYESPEKVGFRGDFKPELVQLLMRLRQDDRPGESGGGEAPLSPEQLKELIEKSAEITLSDLADGDLAVTSGMFVDNLMKEAEARPQKKAQSAVGEELDDDADDDGEPLTPEPKVFLYDEWDFRAGDYRPRWCRLTEEVLTEGETDFFEKTSREKASLIAQTRKQFELLRPELFRKIKRLQDGEDFDLDAAIEYVTERRAGVTPTDKVYWSRNKVERDVSVAFLLDMSASTDEEIERRAPDYGDDDFEDDPRQYLAWWATRRAQKVLTPPKRIIDVEKESVVLLINALETIGDAYGIYGFSGYGRDNVEFYVIKDLAETFGDPIRKRIDQITPVRSTRMGPAIRHATAKLIENEAKVKILFLVSDGRPQDHGYGRDRTEKEYAIHDTKMALTEAKRRGVTPFALTVDRNGHDYLKQMCDDMGYEVLFDVEELPRRLPALYRRLTE